MNKDTVVASVIGFGLGLIAAIALWVVPRVLPKTAPQAQTAQTQQEETVAGNSDENFVIATPTDGEITSNKSLTIEGQAANASLVIVSTASTSAVVTPSENGSFSASVELTEGSNEIAITRFGAEEKTQNITVYYLTEEI